MDCIFCKIVGGEIPSSKVYEDEYVCAFDRTLPFITKYITLFPGDVVTLGCIAQRITLKKDEILDGMKIEAEIDGLPPVSFSLRHSLARDNSIPVNQLKL